jgi:hypothetical protein
MTQPVFPTLPEKQTLDLEISQLLETIDDILVEFDRPTCVTPYKNAFLEDFMKIKPPNSSMTDTFNRNPVNKHASCLICFLFPLLF